MNASTWHRNILWVSIVVVATTIGAIFVLSTVADEKKSVDKGAAHEVAISMLKPPKLTADKKVTIRVTVVNKSSHEIEGNGTIVLRRRSTGETLVEHLPGMVKRKTLRREFDMVDAPDQCISCFRANDVHGDWFHTYSPDKQFLSVTIELRD